MAGNARRTLPAEAHPGPRGAPRPPIQRELAVGAVHDRHEREADRVADHAVADTPSAAPPPVVSGVSVQRSPARSAGGPEQIDDDQRAPEERAQRAAEGPGGDGGVAPPAVESSIARMRAGPAPGLDPATRSHMEGRMGTDLGGVRVHTSRAAGEAARSLNARAFTVGQDVFFAPGQYDTSSRQGRHLLAHELAHTVQQRGGSAGARRVQRNEDGTGGNGSSGTQQQDEGNTEPEEITSLGGEHGTFDLTRAGDNAGTLNLPKLELPRLGDKLKGEAGSELGPAAGGGRSLPVSGRPFVLDKVPPRPEGRAYATWEAYIRQHHRETLKTAIEARIAAQGNAAAVIQDGTPVYVLKQSNASATSSTDLLVGTTEELAGNSGVVRPMIDPGGSYRRLDADHILELQIGGEDAATNMCLLQSDFNSTVGPQIKGKIDASVTAALREAESDLRTRKAANPQATPVQALPSDAGQVKRNWRISFATVVQGASFGTTNNFWSRAAIGAGAHLEHFEALSEPELVQRGFRFQPGTVPAQIYVFPTRAGGRPTRFGVSGGGETLVPPRSTWRGIEVLEVIEFHPPTSEGMGGTLARLRVRKQRVRRGTEIVEAGESEITVRHDPRLGYGGYVTKDSLSAAFRNVEFTKLSPITFDDVALTSEGELSAIGSILSSKSLIPGLQVPILLRGTDVLIQFPLPTEGLDFGPLHVVDAALELGVGENGFFIQGVAGLVIERVGSGRVVARVERDDVILSGDFTLDLPFVDSAEVGVEYSLGEDALSGEARLTVERGRLPGIEGGEIHVTVSRESFGVTGTLELGGALAGSTVTVGYTPETGLLIEGRNIPLPVARLPGVRDATVSVRAVRSPETGLWSFGGEGQANLDVAGVTGRLDVAVDGDQLRVGGRADFARGPAEGWLEVTATNQAVGDDGEPIEDAPAGDLRIWGRGEVSIAFGRFLTGTAGLEYTEDGRVIVSGEIALPPTVDVFDRQEYSREILHVRPPDFPIWGVKLGPVGLGIFAFVDARIDFSAFVGPGQLRDTALGVTFDLERPEDAEVEGNASFVVPAYAGFTLDIGGGLKAVVTAAYVQGRVGLQGTLGAEAEAAVDVGVAWNRTDGLALEAEPRIALRPKFELGVNASITAGVDLGLWDISKTWGPWVKTLGAFGPDVELGVRFPVGWSEQDGLRMSLDDIEVQRPAFDAKGVMKDAFDTLV